MRDSTPLEIGIHPSLGVSQLQIISNKHPTKARYELCHQHFYRIQNVKSNKQAPAPKLATIPVELRELSQWRPWRWTPPIKPGGKPGKVPLSAVTLLKSNDTEHLTDCTTFETLAAMLLKEQQKPYSEQLFHGVVLSLNYGEYTVVDLDKVVDESGLLDDRAKEIIENTPGYVERSVSGVGYHIITKLDGWGNHNHSDQVWGLEVFRGKKFVAITGDVDEQFSQPIPDLPVSAASILKYSSQVNQKESEPYDAFEAWGNVDHSMSLAEAEKLVMSIEPQVNPGSSRQFWLSIGMSLHCQFSGAYEALELWNKYSEQSDAGEYAGFSDLEKAWDSFRSTKSNLYTAATLRHYAKEYPREIKVDDETVFDKFRPIEYTTNKLFTQSYVIDGFLTAEIITIAGAAGIGKSSMLVPLAATAAHICNPEDPLKPKLRRKVIYMTEDPNQVIRILFGLRKHGGITLTDDEIKDWFYIIPTIRSSKEELAGLIRAYSASKTVIQSGKKGDVKVPPLFVFDTAAATFGLDNENDNSEVSDAISICKQACLETRTPLWIIAHIAKALTRAELSELSIRGAGAWAGDVHGTAFIGMDQGVSNKRFLQLGKKRHVPAYDTLEFEAHFHSYLAEDELGDMVEVNYMFGTAKQTSTKERNVNREIARHDELSKKVISIVAGFNSSNVAINRTSLRQRVGGSVVLATEAIDRLILEGVLEEYDYPSKTNNRQKTAIRLVNPPNFDV